MPEGDTIHRTAATLRRVLQGREVRSFDLPRWPGRQPARRTRIAAVEARGKHLLVRFADGLVLHTHLRMTGSWHVYRPGERWRRARSAARAVVEVHGAVAVCFNAPVVELLDETALARHPVLRLLGPDLCRPDADLGAALDRMERLVAPQAPIAQALLDQRVACGIGNVYKSETLHACGVHPGTPVGAVPPGMRHRLLAVAAAQLRANLDGFPRTTVPGAHPGTLAVYDRTGRPCRSCGTAIEAQRLGEPPRVTFWCGTCQPADGHRARSADRP